MEPTRCHVSMVLERAVMMLRQLVPTIILMFVSLRNLPSLWIAIGISAIVVLSAIYLVLLWRRTYVYTSEDQLIVSTGVFWKKQTAIPFDKINTVDLSRNVIQRILGTSRLKVDTGAVKVAKSNSELDLVFSLEKARELRKNILQLADNAKQREQDVISEEIAESSNDQTQSTSSAWQHTDNRSSDQKISAAAFFGVNELEEDTDLSNSDDISHESSYQADIRSLIIYALTKSKIGAGILAIFSFLAIFDELISEELIMKAEQGFKRAADTLVSQQLVFLVLMAFVIILIIYVLANVITIILTIIKYYHFRARRSSDHLYIRYGLLTEKSFSMPVKNIHAIIIKQSLIRKKLGMLSIEVQSIGYGDDDKETALLMPLVKADESIMFLQNLLPEYAVNTELNVPPRRSLRRFMLVPLLLVFLIVVIPSLIWFKPGLLALVLLMPLVAFSRWLGYKNSAIGYNEKVVEIRNGSWHSSLYRIKAEAVQTIGTRAHPLLRRDGLAHYELNYHAPVLSSSVWASFLESRHLDELRTLLENSD